MVKTFLAIAAPFLLFAPGLSGQDFMNGSFEQNGGRCLINTTPAIFNANVAHTRAFGFSRKPDIASSDCGFGTAHTGNWFVGLASNIQGNVRSEAITLELNNPVQKGQQYTLSFWVRSRTTASNLTLGLSEKDSLGGVNFYTVSAQSITANWTEVSVRFTAPANGRYISVRASHPELNAGVWLDDFKLRPVFLADVVVNTTPAPKATQTAQPKTQETTGIEIFPNPSEGLFRITLDSSHVLSMTVYNMVGTAVQQHVASESNPFPDRIDLTDQVPGLYFVELQTTAGKITRRVVIQRG
ncbi:MAG: T9SS type A sorting domain-containing protein [Bacteroidia bacterium]